jgi:hypothetical protein
MSDKPNENLPARTGEMAMGPRGIQLLTYEDAYRFAKTVIESGFAPKGMTRNAQVLIALQTGAEAGLTPMQSLSSVVVVNGRASWMGDAAKAIVRRAGLLEPGTDFETRIDGDGDTMKATATAHRRGQRMPVTYTFDVADAKRAGLWGKAGPWTQYPKRMLKYRAEGFLLRDHFSDALMGLYTEAEAIDIPSSDGALSARPAPEPDPLLEGAGKPEPAIVDAEYDETDTDPVGGETETAPEQEAGTATEAPSEAPVLSSTAPAPVVGPPSIWNPKGCCFACGRHRRFAEHEGHGKDEDGNPCRYQGMF